MTCQTEHHIDPASYLQALADANENKPKLAHELRGMIEVFHKQERQAMLVAAEITEYQERLAAAAALQIEDTKTIADLKAQLAAVPPAPPADHVLDDADVAAVKSAQSDLGLNDDGTPKAV